MIYEIENLALFLSFTFSFVLTIIITPKLIQKMLISDFCGVDVNKKNKPRIPEMGGLAAVLGFSLGITTALGIVKYFSTINEIPVLVSICVVCIASLIGLLDDISVLGRKEKAWLITLASFPLIISQIGNESINLIIYDFSFNDKSLFFWLILVPLGISGCANAINMSAGYNGLEVGQISIISFALLIISIIDSTPISISIIYSSIFGANIGLFIFNKYPSKIFVGDVGTLGFGALLSTTLIMSGHIVYGIICITPTFFELFATIKYYFKGIERRDACMNPEILEGGILRPPSGTGDYTLAYFILNYFPSDEMTLVRRMLFIYLFFGIVSILIYLISK